MKKNLLSKVLSLILALSMICGTLGNMAAYADSDSDQTQVSDSSQDFLLTNNRSVKNSNLIAYYPLQSDAKDKSGNNEDATIKGTGAAFDGSALTLPGGTYNSGAAYLQLPTGMFDNQNTLTISLWLKNQTGAGNYSAMFFGKSNCPPTRYWLFNPCSPDGYYKSVLTNREDSQPWNTEKGISTGFKTDSNWDMYTIVITSGKMVCYYNGNKIGENDSVTTQISEWGSNLVSYIGRSNYCSSSYPDQFYKGSVKNVRVYGGELSADDISDLYTSDQLTDAGNALSIGNISAVRDNLTLPATGLNSSSVTWKSDNGAIISDAGVVTRPTDGKNATVTLTATLTLSGKSITKNFEVTVLADDTQGDLEAAKGKLNLLTTVAAQDLTLPQTGSCGTSISWSSSDQNVITNSGKITRPTVGEGNSHATLTATISLNGKSVTKTFPIEVLEQYDGYVMSYTTGTNDEQASLHLAYSNDGKKWIALNSNVGICFPTIPNTNSNKSLSAGIGFSSPFLFRKADGTFGFIATQDDNSASIYMYDSKDLITYSNERVLETNKAIGNPTKLQCVYDTDLDAFRINWEANGKQYSNRTTDFKSLTDAEQHPYTPFSDANSQSLPDNAIEGNIIQVTKSEMNAIVKKFGTVTNTGVEPVEVTTKTGTAPSMPSTVMADYSDGSTAAMHVTWNTVACNFTKEGTYQVTGTIQQTEYDNPLILRRADPYVVKADDGYYYFTASYPAYGSVDNGYDRIVLRRSKTIAGLESAGEKAIWYAHSSGIMAKHIWAPEMHKINGKWYLFFAGGASTNIWAIRPYVLQCNGNDPYADTWTEKGQVQNMPVSDSMSLDMTYFEHDGRGYVVWAQIGGKDTDGNSVGPSSLYMAQVDMDQPWILTGKTICLSSPEYAWERDGEIVNEGPAVLERNGKIFVAYSASGTGEGYCIGMLSANSDSDIMNLNSWTKTPYPVLSTADLEGESGPGHNSFTLDEDGNVVIVYHARVKGATISGDPLYDPNRHARVKRVHWGADGTPILKMSYENELKSEYKTITAKVIVSNRAAQVDKSSLSSLYNQCKNLTQGSFTNTSWSSFVSALNQAKSVLADNNATQNAVNQAETVLRNAKNGLTSESSSSSGSSQKENKKSQPSSPTGPYSPVAPVKNNHFTSDTTGTYHFSNSSACYYYKITTTDTFAPSAVSSDPAVATVTLAQKLPDGYLFRITNLGIGNAVITTTAGDGTKTAFTVQGTGAAGVVVSDTPYQHRVTSGKTYQFKFTVDAGSGIPAFETGNNNIIKGISVRRIGNVYYYTIQAVSKGSAGVYVVLPGKPQIRKCVVTIF